MPDNKTDRISRRKFILSTAGTVAATGMAAALSSCGKTQHAEINTGKMPVRVLGKTGLDVSALAFGGGSQFLINKDGVWESMLEQAYQSGVNLFDTASSYKAEKELCSEERYGQVLSGFRDKVVISTKFDGRDVDSMMVEVETSLKNLKTDYIDILFIHSIDVNDDLAVLEQGIYSRLTQLKSEGVVNFIGFTSMNSAEKSRDILINWDVDVCILALNPTKYGQFAQIALPEAHKRNVGVIAMKVFRDIVGPDAPAKELLQYSLSLPGVDSAVIGHANTKVFEENLNLFHEMYLNEPSKLKNIELEDRLAHLSSPQHLCWAKPGYIDGIC